MQIPDTLLGGRTPEEFLKAYWQKRPLLIRGALPDFESPLTPEELAGLALEEDAESRLILEKGGDYPWQLRYGPFDEEDFLSLPESDWTLLVQEVDRWVPEVADLLAYFRFIPQWRIDDVMVSFAPDGGNVGAHVDNYDVFLLQALGRREWRIGSTPVEEEQLVPDVDVSMLSDFEAADLWTLEPGDMLYLPPRIAHHGIAVGDCMTFSIGFRAPSHEDLLMEMARRAAVETDPLTRYGDADLLPSANPALISEDVLARVREIVYGSLSEENVARWFGSIVTESRRGDMLFPSEEDWSPEHLVEAILSGARLARIAPNRFAYVERPGGRAILFAHGDAFELEVGASFAAGLIAGADTLDATTLGPALEFASVSDLLARLVSDGHLEVLNED